MFSIEMLPAQQGDALWIEYGSEDAPTRILVDAGTPPTYKAVKAKVLELAPEDRRFELLVVTHIDTDHIGGVLKLLGDRSLGLSFDEVWFNAWRHITPEAVDRLGPIDGEILSVLLDEAGFAWNASFDGGPVAVPSRGSLPKRTLPGGMKLTVLSPARAQLENLREEWSSVVREAGLDPDHPSPALAALAKRKGVSIPDRLGGARPNVKALAATDFEPDRAVANGSTIGLLAEFDGKRALLTGDAFPEVLTPSIGRLLARSEADRLAVDAFKLPHHGSMHNVSADLVDVVAADRFLFSSNGNIFGHPDPEAVARVVTHSGGRPELCFNYRTEINEVWDDSTLRRSFRYTTVYSEEEAGGLRVEL
jgi:hypothetical protein